MQDAAGREFRGPTFTALDERLSSQKQKDRHSRLQGNDGLYLPNHSIIGKNHIVGAVSSPRFAPGTALLQQ
jgi:hypothetical protein